jgi:fatty acid desaturase
VRLPVLRYCLANALGLAAVVGLWAGGWCLLASAALTAAVGAMADELIGDEPETPGGDDAFLHDANLYLAVPILLAATAGLMSSVARLAPGEVWPVLELGLACLQLGYLYALIGATVAHELIHRAGSRVASVCASILLAFTFNTSFAIFHVRGHHVLAARWDDPATARRGESWLTFFRRTTVSQTAFAFRSEAARLGREGRRAFSWRNGVLLRQAWSVALLVAVGAAGGYRGLLAFLAAALVGRVFHELINYVQHYGMVRADGAPVLARHSWNTRRLISNLLHYNLPRHAEHHAAASRPFWRLSVRADGPELPFGYQNMAMLAMVPSLWRRMMAPRLAAWDRSFASTEERALLRTRGWEGRC